MNTTGLYKNVPYGLLLIRIGLGIMMMLHGWPKIEGGSEKWVAIGGGMKSFGIDFIPGFWGFMAAVGEFVGGLLLLTGLLFRISLLALLSVMLVAIRVHVAGEDGFGGISHPLELAIIFFGLLFTGPGAFSLDAYIKKVIKRG